MLVRQIDESYWQPNLPIHGSSAYLATRECRTICFGGFHEGVLNFVLSLWVFRKGPFYWAMPSGDTMIIDDRGIDAEQRFLESVVSELEKIGIQWIAHSPTNGVFRTFPGGALAVRFGSYRIDLKRDEAVLWSSIHSKHRNVIRNAQRLGLRIERNICDYGKVYAMLARTMERSGKNFESRRKFDQLIESLKGNVEIFCVIEGEGVCGCAVMPWSFHSANYLWGGSPDSPPLGAMNLLHWEAMLYFRSLGVQTYDFFGARITPEPGSKLEGIQRFKARFGAEMAEGYLWKYPLNPTAYWAFNSARSFYHQLKGERWSGDVVDQEMGIRKLASCTV